MLRWIRPIAAFTVVAGLGLAVAGCNNTSSSPKADKMSGDKMGSDKMGDKMGSDKMGGDKMGGDKMGDKMKDKPGS
jgi:pentapeptide MXKDX repeat protein